MFTYGWASLLLAASIIVGALDFTGQTFERYFESGFVYLIPPMVWVLCTFIASCFPGTKEAVVLQLPDFFRIAFKTSEVFAWIAFIVGNVLFYAWIFASTEEEWLVLFVIVYGILLSPSLVLSVIRYCSFHVGSKQIGPEQLSEISNNTSNICASIDASVSDDEVSKTHSIPSLKEMLAPLVPGMREVMKTLVFNPWMHRIYLGLVVCTLVYFGWVVTRPVALMPADLNDEYQLVRDAVPMDGYVVVRMPEGAHPLWDRFKISFDPDIKTYWARTGVPGYAAFKLATNLAENDFYTISYVDEKGGVTIEKEFKAVRRPRLEVFEPGEGANIHEESILTFTFNRPMIPLQGLDRDYEMDLPISITPVTEGEFRWVSQRQLEFVPATRLTRSSEYTVSIDENFRSVDGLEVPPARYSFTVRPLSRWGSSATSVRVQDPIVFGFNQPVDLDAFNVSVFDSNDAPVPLDINYASSLTYNPETEQKERIVDRGRITVTPSNNNRRWEFGGVYRYEVKNIRPLEGSLTVEDFEGTFRARTLLMSTQVYSERTANASRDYFDPTGSIRLSFSEAVSLENFEVLGKGIETIRYRNYCKGLRDSGECENSFDDSVVEILFDETQFGFQEEFTVSLGSVRNKEGEVLGNLQEEIVLTTVGDLTIDEVIASDLGQGMYLCTSNPLIAYDADTQEELLVANNEVARFRAVQRSQFIYKSDDRSLLAKQPECAGSYKTKISYQLKSNTEYDMVLTPTDVFGNSVATQVSFKTNKEPFRWEFGNTVTTEDPWLDNLHPVYTVTRPDRTRYTYTTGNLDSVEVSICELDPAAMVKIMGTLKRGESGPSSCVDKKQFTQSLPATAGPDYFQVNVADHFVDPRGHYVITITNPQLIFTYWNDVTDTQEEMQYYDHMYTSVTNLSLVEKRTNQTNYTYGGESISRKSDLLDSDKPASLYWVNDLRTMEPVAEASVFVFKDMQPGEGTRIELNTSATTNAEGVAWTKVVPDAAGAYVVAGDDSALVTSWGDRLTYASQARESESVYTYTDRPIYRPGDEVGIKGIHRIGYDGDFEILETEGLILEVRDARRNVIEKNEVSINDFGTFNQTITLPEDASLGTYTLQIKTLSGNRVGSGYFSVEEYVGSPFEVRTFSEQDEYVAGDMLEVAIDAQYFFGAPLPEGTVSYTISTQDYFFDRSQDSRFRFGGDWYRCWYCSSNDRFVSRGTGKLSGGVFMISEELDFTALFNDEDDRTRSKIFVIDATVTDANGRSVSAQESFIVHRAEHYVALKALNRLVESNQPTTLQMKTVDTQGVAVSDDLSLTIERLSWETYKRREVDGSFYRNSEQVRTVIREDTLRTDGSGVATYPMVYPEPGQYEVHIYGVDDRGNGYSETITQYVYGDDVAPVRRYNDRTLDIVVEDTELDVGEQSKLVIQSPYESAKALITIERGAVMDYEIVDVNANFFDYDYVAEAEHAPNIVTSVVLVSPDPEIKYGQVQFSVDREVYNLDISVTSNKEAYLPGEEVTLFVQTKNQSGAPVPAEVSIAAVDLSVLALKGNPERDPLVHFYRGLPHNVITSSNLKFVHEEIEIPTGTKGGGGNAEDLSKRERGVFKDTAFWAAAVETDASGQAIVKFTLPDNLTRWRVETIGVTKDTKVGVDYMEFLERKDLITTPLIPRFMIPGDKVSLGAEILNRTNTPQFVTFSVESETLELPTETQSAIVPAEGAVRLYVETESPRDMEAGVHEIRFKAGNGRLEDAIVKEVPVMENTLYETVFLSGLTNGAQAKESFFTPQNIHEEVGEVEIKAFSTVGAYLEDSINYMAAYPYGCSEQLASRIATLATAQHLASLDTIGDEYSFDTVEHNGRSYAIDDAVAEGLERIYAAQTSDGGFGYYYGLDSDVALSLHIISVLLLLDDIGVQVNQKVLERAVSYVADEGNKREHRDAISGDYRSLSYLLVKAYQLQKIEPRPRAVDTVIADIRTAITRKSVKTMGTHELVYAALLSDELWWFDRWNVWREVDARLRENLDGVYVSKNPVRLAKSFYETDIANTAILLRAIIHTGRMEEQAPDIVRWLLEQRSFDGAWSTTNTTHTVTQTMVEYIDWKDEQNAEGVITALLGGERVAIHDPSQEPRLDGLTYEVGYDTLGTSTEHELLFEQSDVADRNDTMYYDVAMKYYLDQEVTPARDEGVRVARAFYALEDIDYEDPITTARVGDTVVARVTFTVSSPMRMVGYEDRIPAGFEIINFDYDTENKAVLDAARRAVREEQEPFDVTGFMETAEFASLEEVVVYKDEREAKRPSRRSYARAYRASIDELHDDRIFRFSERLEPGTYVHEYYVRALVPGTFQHLPVWIGEMYNPEFFGRTESTDFTVLPKE